MLAGRKSDVAVVNPATASDIIKVLRTAHSSARCCVQPLHPASMAGQLALHRSCQLAGVALHTAQQGCQATQTQW